MGRSKWPAGAIFTVLALVAWLLYGATPAVPRSTAAVAPASVPSDGGYWLVASDGGIFNFDAPYHGSTGGTPLNKPIVGMATDPATGGYWLVASDGGIFNFDAPYHGSTGGTPLNKPIVGMATDPATGGYWLVASDGGIFNFDAPYYGSTGNVHLNRPIVGMAASPDGRGYFLVASDGGVFPFGDAHFHGSTGATPLNKPIVGMATDPATGGYWLVASDGGIFNFDAPYHGSTGAVALNKPIIGMASTPDGGGYYLAASDGGIFPFGDAHFHGSTGNVHLNRPIVGIAALTPSTICQSGPIGPQPGVTNTTITIGNISTVNGPVPAEFVGARQGVEAFAAFADSQGGLCGRHVLVDSADDQSSPSTNGTLTKTLAPAVLAFVGSYSGSDAGGATTLATDAIPDIGEADSTSRFDLSENFSPEPRPSGWNLAPYTYFKGRFPGATQHMALLAEATTSSLALADEEEAALQSIGYRFVFVDRTIQPSDPTFNGDVSKMKSAGVQGVILQAPTGALYAGLANAMFNGGLSVPFANWGLDAYSPAFLSDGGTNVNGSLLAQSEALFAGEDASVVPEVRIFDHWYETLFHQAPDLYAAYGWMSGLLFAEGLQAAGIPTRASLLAGLHTVTHFAAGGLVAPDNPSAKKPPNCYLIVDVTNGHFVRDPVDPKSGFDCAGTPDFRFG